MDKDRIAAILAGRAPTDEQDLGFKMWQDLVWDFANAVDGRAAARLAFADRCDSHGLLDSEGEEQ